MNCCSVSHAKDHQHHIKSLSAPHNTRQKKKKFHVFGSRWSKLSPTIQQSIQKYFLLEATNEEFKTKPQICKEFIQWDRIIIFCRNSWLEWFVGFFFFKWHCTTCLPMSLFKISRIFASLMLVLCKSNEQLVYTWRFNKDFNFPTKRISRN